MNGRERIYRTDVGVVGGGAAGLAAAVASAREGARTCLIEAHGFLGGTATAALVGRFQEGPAVNGEPVIRGLYEEICQRLRDYGTLHDGLFDQEMLKYVAFDLCEESGVDLLLHSTVYDAHTSPGHVDALSLTTRQQRYELEADVYVDATGDGTVSDLAGAAFEMGEGGKGAVQPMTLVFQIGNIDQDQFEGADWGKLSAILRQELPELSFRDKLFYYEWVEGMLGFCLSHVAGRNPLDVEDLSQAEIDARRQALDVLTFFRRHVPGCERCNLITAPEIGVRESRRIVGEFVLTREDVLGCRKFEDSVGCSTSWIDMHTPEARGVLHELVKPDDWFEIPYRSLCVKGFDNLIVTGRCLSATHEAQGAIREIPTCIVTGQGAGVGAALAARANSSVGQVDTRWLQERLAAQGVRLRDAD